MPINVSYSPTPDTDQELHMYTMTVQGRLQLWAVSDQDATEQIKNGHLNIQIHGIHYGVQKMDIQIVDVTKDETIEF